MNRIVKNHNLCQSNSKKLIYLEFLRIISIILVIFNHTGANGFFLYALSEFSVFYPFYFFCSIACKVAVPLFWMISGALLIPREESISELYKKRIFKILMALIVFSFIQYLFWVFGDESRTFYIWDFVKTLYTSHFGMAYWYIYAYIGVLLVLPLIRKMARNMNRKEYIYLFSLSLTIYGIIPIVQYLLWQGNIVINMNVTWSMFSEYLVYFMAGNYFGNVLGKEDISGKKAGMYIASGFMAIIISCFMTKFMTNITGMIGESEAQTFYNNLIMIPSFSIFYSVRYLSIKYEKYLSQGVKNIIYTLGSAVFGVMLTENLWRERLEVVFYFLKPYCKIFPSCIIWVLITWICASVTILLIKKIPFVRRVL